MSLRTILHILAINKRDKLDNKFSVYIDPDASGIEALTINYKFWHYLLAPTMPARWANK